MDTTVVCSNCKTPNPAGNAFCQTCGKQLSAPAVPPPAPTKASTPPPMMPAATPPPVAPVAQTAQVPPVMPAPVAQPPGPRAVVHPIRVLGVKIDEFSDILTDSAGKSQRISDEFLSAFKEKEIPNVNFTKAEFSAGGKSRTYHLATAKNYVTMLVDISPFGKDLKVGWDMYYRRPVRWLTLALIGAATLILPILSALQGGYGMGIVFVFSSYWTMLFTILLTAGLATLLLGKILKEDWTYFYVEEMDDLAWSDAIALQLAVHDALLTAMETGSIESFKPATKATAKPAKKPAAKAKPAAKPKKK